MQKANSTDLSSNSSFPQEEEIVAKLTQTREAVITLRKLTRARVEMRTPLSTSRLFTALLEKLHRANERHRFTSKSFIGESEQS